MYLPIESSVNVNEASTKLTETKRNSLLFIELCTSLPINLSKFHYIATFTNIRQTFERL